jgi:hypothetical protein
VEHHGRTIEEYQLCIMFIVVYIMFVWCRCTGSLVSTVAVAYMPTNNNSADVGTGVTAVLKVIESTFMWGVLR